MKMRRRASGLAGVRGVMAFRMGTSGKVNAAFSDLEERGEQSLFNFM